MRVVAVFIFVLSVAACATEVLPSPAPTTPAGFTCQLPITAAGTGAQAVDALAVRAEAHDQFDRLIFDFERGLPALELTSTLPPFTSDPRNQVLQVDGNVFARIVFGGSRVGSDGSRFTLVGRRLNLDPRLSELIALRQQGDFEGVVTLIAGLRASSCVRLSTTDGVSGYHVMLDFAAQ